MNFRRSIAAGVAACTLLLLAACGGGGGAGGGIGGSGAPLGKGTMRASMTDAPSCGYDAVHVTIDKLRVHQSGNAAESDSGWVDIPLSGPRRVDLLTLTNGVLFPLGEVPLTAGNYQQMRLVLAGNTQANPLANSVTPTGGAETPMDTPSAQQSGLKLNMNVDVPAGQVVDVVLDFDACKSVVRRGNSGRYNLKPVVTVIPVVNAGGQRVEGWVDLSLASGSTFVSLQSQGLPVKTGIPDSQGRFVLFPVPAGNYDLVVSAPGRVSAALTGVPVGNTAVTTVGSSNLRVNPPATLMRPVGGMVSPATATVRAVQTLAGGPSIEVASPPVDAQTGAFAMDLPIAAPVRAPYVANAPSFGFTADAAVAGLYTVQANANGGVQNAAVNTAAPVPPLSFSLP
ncbi:DUF4382 domain-containing protein [Variovorax sp. OV329]|uniref:DUF4382 domain-containing protein n=1 Tax=Variovorax sp. OV329 TaxID=1882825 RepID=UPI0008ECBC65|nr:DUF4382 domain-containing protein [Variovorax sp. OV329]SFN03833.1 protein of unknown function [Variovorax sp. OV329]